MSILQWNSCTMYSTGNVVRFNGKFKKATNFPDSPESEYKSNVNIQPLDDSKYWEDFEFATEGVISEPSEGFCSLNNEVTIQNEPSELSISSLIKSPVRYDKMGAMIFDAENNHVVDIRGWGRFMYMKNSDEVQDSIGVFIASAINEKLASK